MSQVVVDVSLAFKWLVSEHDSPAANTLLGRWGQQGLQVVVPSWFTCELANALHRQVWQGTTTSARATVLLRFIFYWVKVLEPQPTLAVRAMEIADQLGQPAVYDSQYVALAEHLNCELWTADERFAQVAQAVFPFVHWLGEPQTGTGQAGP